MEGSCKDSVKSERLNIDAMADFSQGIEQLPLCKITEGKRINNSRSKPIILHRNLKISPRCFRRRDTPAWLDSHHATELIANNSEEPLIGFSDV